VRDEEPQEHQLQEHYVVNQKREDQKNLGATTGI